MRLNKTTFTYRIFLGTATKNLSIIDIKVGRPGGLSAQYDSSNPSGLWFTNQKGDPSANYFGAQDPDFDVFRWNLPACFYTGYISLTFKGNVVANSSQMLLKPVPWADPTYPVGNVLVPLCEAAQAQEKIITTGTQYVQ